MLELQRCTKPNVALSSLIHSTHSYQRAFFLNLNLITSGPGLKTWQRPSEDKIKIPSFLALLPFSSLIYLISSLAPYLCQILVEHKHILLIHTSAFLPVMFLPNPPPPANRMNSYSHLKTPQNFCTAHQMSNVISTIQSSV